MNKLLLIVYPHVAFINGSFPLPGADVAIDHLAAYILSQYGLYRRVGRSPV